MRKVPGLAMLAVIALGGCAGSPGTRNAETVQMSADSEIEVLGAVRVTRHEGADDLVSGGLGLAGLRNPLPPPPADPMAPTATELRRMALHTNWRGIADLSPGGAVETRFPELPVVTGEEHAALLRLPGRHAPHRVLLQVPDGFDPGRPCLVVAPASGSRGVYGAISVAAPWALPRGCALAMTDKGAGTDVFDPASGTGTTLDGTRARAGAAPLAFVPPGFSQPRTDTRLLALRHLHSGDNPERDWGLHTLQAARWALDRLSEKFGRRIDADSTRVIAVAVSNGGGAVLQAAGHDADGLLDAVVAGEPNVTAAGARPLYDYATEAALYQGCALLDPRMEGIPFVGEPQRALAALRCKSLARAGLLEGNDVQAQAGDAYRRLVAGGWTRQALEQAGLNVSFDLWRAVAAGYAGAYARAPFDAMPCGYGYAAIDAAGQPVAASEPVLTLWGSLGPGIPPAAGIGLIDTRAGGIDPALPGLQCLRDLYQGEDETARALRTGIEETRVRAQPKVPTIVLHGAGDGLVPAVFSSRPYVAAALAADAPVTYWEVEHAQHFDAFLAVPEMFARYVPLLPYLWQALDQQWARLESGAPVAPSQVVRTQPRTTLAPLAAPQTGGLRTDPGANAITQADGGLRVPLD
ncbi:MAG TPA: 3-hydroxybutyrate oligomer hydrolase family protein [Xanthomonadaceae bacterium]|nr:3-hydroxybutyrate oligomer hydrolase family protein [Xanthomonadaceae bacterium]